MAQRLLMEDVGSPGAGLAAVESPAEWDPRRLFAMEPATMDTRQPRMFTDVQYQDWRKNFEQARARKLSFRDPGEYDQWFRSNLDQRAPMFRDRLNKDYWAAMPDDLKQQVMGKAKEIAARRQAAPVVQAFQQGEMGAGTPAAGAVTAPEFNAFQKGAEAKAQRDEAARQEQAARERVANAAADNTRADRSTALQERELNLREGQMKANQDTTGAAQKRIDDFFDRGPGAGKAAPWVEKTDRGIYTYYNPITREIKSYQSSERINPLTGLLIPDDEPPPPPPPDSQVDLVSSEGIMRAYREKKIDRAKAEELLKKAREAK